MEYTDDTEDFNEWQQIEQNPSPQTSSPTVHQSSAEGSLQIVPTTIDLEHGTSSPSGAVPIPAALPSDWRFRVANEGRKLFQAMRGRVVRVASKVRNCAIYIGAFWSIMCVTGAAAAAAVLASLLYMEIRRRRRRVGRRSVDYLVYLLREKDEKISQLLLQIAQLNEVLSSRRKVPVLRIGS